jgi:hypothetical protein
MIRFIESQIIFMAQFLTELERQGITYTVEALMDGWSITITGH